MRWVFPALVMACSAYGTQANSYEMKVQGALEQTVRGRTESGIAGTAKAPYYTITLGGAEGDAAAVFTRAGPTPPSEGAYPVGEAVLDGNGFSGLIITGQPAHPTGVFRVQGGTLTITAVTGGRLSGRFALQAAGFLTSAPADDARRITASGWFSAQTADRDSIRMLDLRLRH